MIKWLPDIDGLSSKEIIPKMNIQIRKFDILSLLESDEKKLEEIRRGKKNCQKFLSIIKGRKTGIETTAIENPYDD